MARTAKAKSTQQKEPEPTAAELMAQLAQKEAEVLRERERNRVLDADRKKLFTENLKMKRRQEIADYDENNADDPKPKKARKDATKAKPSTKKAKDAEVERVDTVCVRFVVDESEISVNRELHGHHDAILVDDILGSFDVETDVS
jgi:hypothetical protein